MPGPRFEFLEDHFSDGCWGANFIGVVTALRRNYRQTIDYFVYNVQHCEAAKKSVALISLKMHDLSQIDARACVGCVTFW